MEKYITLKKLGNELIKKFNINFKNKTDTIVLLELISRYGLLVALKKIEGMFAFGLWDKRDKASFSQRQIRRKTVILLL